MCEVHFTLDMNRQQKVISLDHLKSANLDSFDYPTTPPHTQALLPPPNAQPSSPTPTPSVPVWITHSGCHVLWPDRFVSICIVSFIL